MNIQDIISLYNEGKSLSFIANKYGTYGAKIKQILIDNGIRTRTRAEQNKITNQSRAKKVNHEYFDVIDSNEKAWLLGFLAADGTVSHDKNSIKIALSAVDQTILEDIAGVIELDNKVSTHETNQGFLISELRWTSERHKRQIAKYGIVPRKTYKETHLPSFEEDIDKQFSFILGYYDGDGCFKDDGKYCRFEICAYRPELLEDFAKVLNTLCEREKYVYKDKSRQNYYTLTYSTLDAMAILDKLYSLNISNLYLKRKFLKYIEWLNNNNKVNSPHYNGRI